MIYRADTGLAAFFTVVAAAVRLVLLFCLWQGLLDMQRDAGITPPAAPAAGALLLWYILLYVAAALFASLSLLLGAYLVWYFYLVVRLKKLSKSMAAQGCAIKPIKEHFSNHKLAAHRPRCRHCLWLPVFRLLPHGLDAQRGQHRRTGDRSP